MSDRVNITYSVSLHELGEEVARLIERAYTQLDVTTDHMHGFKEPLSIETFNKIDAVRMRLAGIDASLADINNIVSSYLNYKVGHLSPPMPTEGSEMPPEEGEKMAEALDNLQEKIALFKMHADEDEVTD